MIKKIPVKQLQLGMFIHEMHGSWLSHPFWKSSFLLEDPADLVKINGSGIAEISIDLSKSRQAPAQTAREPEAPASVATLPPEAKTAALSFHNELNRARKLCDRSRQAVMTMFAEARMGNTVSMADARAMVDEVTESVNRHPLALITLARLKTSDNYTYMHSVAVCAMMVALARALKMTEEQVRDAGCAGLLHDVGKMAVPDKILNKPGKLTDEEFIVIKSHPEKGRDILLRAGDISAMVIDVCLHHHEKCDGSGYPHGLKSEDISIFARMGAICDVYDAITSNRPYKEGWGPAESLQRMAQWKGHFDPELLQAFVKVVGIYPIGSLVRLKSQRLAVVVEQNEKSMLKPKVKVFFSIRSKMPLPQAVVDLALPGLEDVIEAREHFENWNFPYMEDLWQSAL
ncbi:HD-GYP domain-containing protein [Pseudohongiella acticola]|jgi:cyclic di-GMP phosphodiesterase|uniref:HD-GYP domain-containing protein n=1 Tax=Pseudohongiella acticola TaxID=1524254 RepID=UPI0030EB970D